MEFGSTNEIDAIATLTGKVLPFVYPEMKYIEEGCMKISSKNDANFMVASPDDSLRVSTEDVPKMMYENKCKAPTSYNPSAYNSIPHYYVLQLLSEIHMLVIPINDSFSCLL